MPTEDATRPEGLPPTLPDQPIVILEPGAVSSDGGALPSGLLAIDVEGKLLLVAPPTTIADLAAQLTGYVTTHYANQATR
jgi:type IV secretory pathway protease TraF